MAEKHPQLFPTAHPEPETSIEAKDPFYEDVKPYETVGQMALFGYARYSNNPEDENIILGEE